MGQFLSVAFVQDALPFMGGAEKVLAAALDFFPEAPIYTLVLIKKPLRTLVMKNIKSSLHSLIIYPALIKITEFSYH
jgi:hypothetical protein